MESQQVLIVKHDDSDYVICTLENYLKFHLYMEAAQAPSWRGVMELLGVDDFLNLWQQQNSDQVLTDGANVLYKPSASSAECESQDLDDPNSWGPIDSDSPLCHIAFFGLVESPPITKDIIKELGGHTDRWHDGVYFDSDPIEIQSVLNSHHISSEIISDIPYERY